MTTPVERNTKRFANVFALATHAQECRVNSAFAGDDVDMTYVRTVLHNQVEKSPDAKVIDLGDGVFRVRFHSNRWIDVHSPA